MKYFPLNDRLSKVDITKAAFTPETITSVNFNFKENSGSISQEDSGLLEKTRALGEEILRARKNGSQVICAFGAHAIKNGLGALLGEMLEKGWFTHLASNGAAVIHDWEFAWLGKSSEDVRENVAAGRFGTWEETGLYINLALASGAWQGLGYASSVGEMILNDGIYIPERDELLGAVRAASEKASTAFDLYELIESERIPSGFLSVPHRFAQYSLLAAARKSEKPFTCHPMFGHDIIYTHRANRGSVIGRTAERDFLEFVAGVESLEGGVYLSIGSAVMSPMIFEKALSMARNAAGREDAIRNCGIYVVDLQESSWDWTKGEPPMNNPAYYQRFMKTFNRMGCKINYITADNRDFFISLYKVLAGSS